MIPGFGRVFLLGFSGGSDSKESPSVREIWVQFLGQEDPLEKGMAVHPSILAWRIPWTEEPGRLQSMGLERVGHDDTVAVLNNVQVTKLTFLVLFVNLPSLQYYRFVNFYFSHLTKSL